jgi:hypothetical protein
MDNIISVYNVGIFRHYHDWEIIRMASKFDTLKMNIQNAAQNLTIFSRQHNLYHGVTNNNPITMGGVVNARPLSQDYTQAIKSGPVVAPGIKSDPGMSDMAPVVKQNAEVPNPPMAKPQELPVRVNPVKTELPPIPPVPGAQPEPSALPTADDLKVSQPIDAREQATISAIVTNGTGSGSVTGQMSYGYLSKSHKQHPFSDKG